MNPNKHFTERRDFLRLGATGALGMMVAASDLLWQTQPAEAQALPPKTPDQALQELIAGNQRFITNQRQCRNQSLEQLQKVACKQIPFAAILSCADSRVAPEIIFDQGIGDIFDVRVAGNIVTRETRGSIEYAVTALGSQLVVVLGHQRCGAVIAAADNEVLPGDINSFVDAIKPCLKGGKPLLDPQCGKPANVDVAVVQNVQCQVRQLQESTLLGKLCPQNLRIVGAVYSLDTGKVTFI